MICFMVSDVLFGGLINLGNFLEFLIFELV